MLALMSILFFVIPIFLTLINLKYLHDVKDESNCEEINSPYINIFFNYYLIELCLLILLVIIFGYIFHNYNKIKDNLKRTH
jgi:preprotein translocase subunit SecG